MVGHQTLDLRVQVRILVPQPTPRRFEWWADSLPERRLGVAGAVLVVLGFALQSLQYWSVLLDIRVY